MGYISDLKDKIDIDAFADEGDVFLIEVNEQFIVVNELIIDGTSEVIIELNGTLGVL